MRALAPIKAPTQLPTTVLRGIFEVADRAVGPGDSDDVVSGTDAEVEVVVEG
jgi:hypothetical protein